MNIRTNRLDPLITRASGKWDKNPEPIAYDPNYGRISDPSLLYHIGESSIGPKSTATFCFLIKYAGEEPCYGFNAQNYFHPGFRVNDNRRMEIGEYMITTIVKGDNVESEATFLLTNNGSRHADVTILRKRGNY